MASSTKNRSGLLSAPESAIKDAPTTSPSSRELPRKEETRTTPSAETTTRLGRRQSRGSTGPSANATLENPGADDRKMQGPIPVPDCPARMEDLSAERANALLGLAEFVRAEVKRAADAETCEHLRETTARVREDADILRLSLGRAEAAIEACQRERELAVAARQAELIRCRRQLHVTQLEAQDHQLRYDLSKRAETALREDLKRSQEALMGLSAWDEEKIELEMEVMDLKGKLKAAVKEGDERLQEARREYELELVQAAQNARKQLERDTEKSRKQLEDGLSDEFRKCRTENEALRREREHQSWEIHRITNTVTRLKAEVSACRDELEDERRMHHRAIGKTKRAEAVIKELKTVIARVLNSNSGSSSTTRQRGGGEFSSAARGKPKRPRSERGNCEPDLGHRTIGDQKYEEQEQWEQAVDERENTPGWRAEAGSVDARGCHNREPSISRSEEEATVPTAPTSVDVWGMLDTYVSRRSDVARANCHVKAIEAMRKHLAKTTTLEPELLLDATTTRKTGATTAANGGRNQGSPSGQNRHNGDGGEASWRASEAGDGGAARRQREGGNISGGVGDTRRGRVALTFPSNAAEPTRSPNGGKQVDAPRKSHNRFHPRPPRVPRDASHGGSLSSLSQITSVDTWGGAGAAGESFLPNIHNHATDACPETPQQALLPGIERPQEGDISRAVATGADAGVGAVRAPGRERGGQGNRLAETNGHNETNGEREGGSAATTTALPYLPPLTLASSSCSFTCRETKEISITVGGGLKVPPTLSRGVVLRPPSFTTSEASAAAANPTTTGGGASCKMRKSKVDAGGSEVFNSAGGASCKMGSTTRYFRKISKGRPLLPPSSKKRNRQGGGGGQGRRKSSSLFGKAELSDWIQANTNLVNVCPW